MTQDQDFKRLGDLLEGAREAPAPARMTGSDTPPAKVSGIPVARLSDTFENFDLTRNPTMAKAMARCLDVAEGREWCALLAGDYGTGKTHLAIAAVLKRLLSGYFWKVPDFLEWVRVQAYGQEIGVLGVLKEYVTGDFLLVLDDLGVEKKTEWADEQLYRVLDARCDLKLPTIITTNQPLDRIDGRLLSRYAEGIVACKGRDVRRGKS